MEQILKNEIRRLINRFPTESELSSAKQYIDECVSTDTTPADMPCMVGDWFDAKMTDCHFCGKYNLIDEMFEVYGDYYCDKLCLHTAEQGVDLHAEARAEYECGNR